MSDNYDDWRNIRIRELEKELARLRDERAALIEGMRDVVKLYGCDKPITMHEFQCSGRADLAQQIIDNLEGGWYLPPNLRQAADAAKEKP